MSLKRVEETYLSLQSRVRKTPVQFWQRNQKTIALKLEFLQYSGSFKARGAFNVILNNLELAKDKGVVAVSKGNHACAVSYVCHVLGLNAKVVIPKGSSPLRIQKCREYGAEVISPDTTHEAFEVVEEIKDKEGRLFVHPFEGEYTSLGTSCVSKEFLDQVPELDEIYVAIGGGGLASGVAMAAKLIKPSIKVIGVEPKGANSMFLSFEKKSPQTIKDIDTIADSLGAPFALQYSYELCQKYIDKIELVSDEQIKKSMKEIYQEFAMILEPSGVAALSGVDMYNSEARNKGVILCGANIDLDLFQQYIQ